MTGEKGVKGQPGNPTQNFIKGEKGERGSPGISAPPPQIDTLSKLLIINEWTLKVVMLCYGSFKTRTQL